MTLSIPEDGNTFDYSIYKNLYANQKKIDEQMKALQEECERKNISFNSPDFDKNNADKKPIFIFGHEHDSDIKNLSERQKENLERKLRDLIQNSNHEQTYFVINAQNQGLSKIFMQILHEEENAGKEVPHVLGLTVPSKSENSNLLPVNALNVDPSHKSEFDLTSLCASRCKNNDGEMFFFGGGGYVSDIITNVHKNGLNIHLDRESGGASADKAKQYFLDDEPEKQEEPEKEIPEKVSEPQKDVDEKIEDNSDEFEMGE